jgi:predicted acetyltransferase
LTKKIFALGAKEIIVDPDKDNITSNMVLEANSYALDEATGYYKIIKEDF